MAVINGVSGVNGVNGTDKIRRMNGGTDARYCILEETRKVLKELLCLARGQIPQECLPLINQVDFKTSNTGTPYFPVPLRESEALTALKAVEAGVAASIADLIYGEKRRRIVVDIERATCFLFSAYLCTVCGMQKGEPKVKSCLKDTDLLQAQSNPYRRLSANLYETKTPGQYFHIHGSLEATTTLNMIGLPGWMPGLTDYRQCVDLIESHVKKFTPEQLEELNAENRQAGVTCLKETEFQNTRHGQALQKEPPWRLDTIETSSPPAPLPAAKSAAPKPQILSGVKVLELCRIIAGPSIGRGLAEYGADVLKVTSSKLSDVPFFQVDGNLGKHTTDLDLKTSDDRATFEQLLHEADVVLDGYRPGSLERLGYGPKQIVELTKSRGRGIIYVAEDCFGHVGEWAGRPGWQQIADCVTGVAWIQGLSMGLNEPVIPPFPMSDYGTGCMGTIAALTALYKRAKYGGSYWATTSLCQYDMFLLRMGLYPRNIIQRLRQQHDDEFYQLRHHDSVDEVGKRALKSMRRVHPELFDPKLMHETYSNAFVGPVKFVKPVIDIEGTWNGFLRSSRPNGFDPASWDDWEVDEEMFKI